MLIVADANELIGALISKKKTLELFFDSRLEIVSPEFILKEFKEHKEEICEKTGLLGEEIESFLFLLKPKIKFFKTEEFKEFLKNAEKISPDPDDVEYLALALRLNCPLWSEDKLLRRQKDVKLFSTYDLIKEFKL